MCIPTLLAAAALGLALAAPAQAGGERPFAGFESRLESLLDPKVWLQGRLTEADVALVFAHLKASMLAAAQGREPPDPEALNRRAEAIGRELRVQSLLAGLLLLDALEAGVRQIVREQLAGPPAVPR